MIFRPQFLRAPEGDGFSGTTGPPDASHFAQKGAESAEARFQSSEPTQPPEPTQLPSEEPAPAPSPEPAPSPAEEAFLDLDYNGQTHKLTKDEVTFLARYALDLWRNAAWQQQPQGAEPAQPEKEPQELQKPPMPMGMTPELQAYVEKEIERRVKPAHDAVQAVQEWKKELAINQMIQETDQAINKFTALKQLSETNPQRAKMIKGLVLSIRSSDPNMSLESAAKVINEMFGEVAQREKSTYVESKIKQSTQKIEGAGGAAPAAQKKPSGFKQIFDGSIMERVMDRLSRAAST